MKYDIPDQWPEIKLGNNSPAYINIFTDDEGKIQVMLYPANKISGYADTENALAGGVLEVFE